MPGRRRPCARQKFAYARVLAVKGFFEPAPLWKWTAAAKPWLTVDKYSAQILQKALCLKKKDNRLKNWLIRSYPAIYVILSNADLSRLPAIPLFGNLVGIKT